MMGGGLQARDWTMLGALLAIWAFFAWQEPVFLSARNLSLLSIELAVTATLALGMLLVLLPGQIDLSAGSGVGLTGAIAAVLVFWHDVPAPLALLAATVVAVAAWALMGAPLALDKPVLEGFNFQGGKVLSPEFMALLIGLSTYTAAFIAEVVRAGILAVDRGQDEAAKALGLSPSQRLRLVTMPQALRVIIPPMTSQYLNLAKNSSLAVAIGYPDLVMVANTTMNQEGQAIEAIAILMAVYLAISLTISLFMNWYNARVRLTER